MRKVFLIIIPVLVGFLIFLGFTFLNRNSGKGALQVTAIPKSNVYLNGSYLGQTPLCKCEVSDMISVGEYKIRVVPIEVGFSPFEEKISIGKSTLTVVDRTFGKGATSEGSVIALSLLDDKKAIELFIVSFPDKARISVDNTDVGETPLLLKTLTESDHEVKVTKKGYKEKIIRIRTINGYKLTTEVFLSINPDLVELTPTPKASSSAKPVLKASILETPVGFLRVREDANISSSEITRVSPGEVFEVADQKEGWVQIILKDGKRGWVSSQYVRIE